MDIFGKLNEKQAEAIRCTEGYVRVIAGAGSGKTRLLVNRYAYLVKDYGIDTANILCVTFTNKAAGEMKNRIRALVGPEYDTSLICTYHGFCARLLRENPEKLFLTDKFQIIDTSQQKSILEEIYEKYELKLDHAGFESILKKIGKIKGNIDYVPRICDPGQRRILPRIETVDDKIIEEFMQRQKATYALDFHDLLNFALYLLETNAQIREKWQDRLNYIQVDEFQDSSRKELRLVDILSQKYGNLLIVGDPDQNIYEWRGSDVRLLVDFDKTHIPTQTIFLNRNYRSTPQILKCANALIDKNELRLKKDLFTLSPAGAEVFHYHSKTEEEENAAITDTVKRLKKENGFSYSDFAVLYRSGFLSRVVEKKLVEVGIPYEIYGGVKFYQRMEVLDVIAYLKLIAYDDDPSFKRVINTPRRRFGRTKLATLERIREDGQTNFSQTDSGSLFSALRNHLHDGTFRGSDAASFVSFIERMRAACAHARISEIVNRVTAESGYEQYIRELGDEERLENLAEFKRIAAEFEKNFGENLSLSEFLQQIALQSGEDDEKPRDAVKLMTIHSAKGLEFPAVFVIGFTEGVFPSSKTIEERKKPGLEEERRLCYVALTRAQKYLFLMDSEGVSQNGMKKLPSRFLREIGVKNYIRIGEISEDLEKESRRYAARIDRQFDVLEDKNVGDRVEHHVFGAGTVISKDQKRGSYVIKFDKLPQTRSISKEYFCPREEIFSSDGFLEKTAESTSETISNTAADRLTGNLSHAKETIPQTPSSVDPSPKISQNAAKKSGDTEDANSPVQCAKGAASDPPTREFCEKFSRKSPEKIPDAFPKQEKPINEPNEMPPKDFPNTQAKDLEKLSGLSATKSEQTPSTPVKQNEDGVRTDIPPAMLPQRQSLLSDFGEKEGIISEEGNDTLCDAKDSTETSDSQSGKNTGRRESVEQYRGAEPFQDLEQSDNLWKRGDVPHAGWRCTGVSDLGSACGICQMCGYQIIRYAHHMVHEHYHPLSVGCVCAGKMEGDIKAAKKREQEFKNRESRRENFKNRKWKNSKNGNPYLRIKHHVIVLCAIRKNDGAWKYSLDGKFCTEVFPSREKAAEGAFEALESQPLSQKGES